MVNSPVIQFLGAATFLGAAITTVLVGHFLGVFLIHRAKLRQRVGKLFPERAL